MTTTDLNCYFEGKCIFINKSFSLAFTFNLKSYCDHVSFITHFLRLFHSNKTFQMMTYHQVNSKF